MLCLLSVCQSEAKTYSQNSRTMMERIGRRLVAL